MRRKNFAPLGLAVAAVAVPLVMAGTALADEETWNVTSGNWSTGANWLDTTAPATDGSADIKFTSTSGTVTSTADATWFGTPVTAAVNKITTSTGKVELTVGATKTLQLGGGGLSTGGAFSLFGSLALTANQTWSAAGTLGLYGNVTSASGVNVTVNGAGMLNAVGTANGFNGNWVFERSNVQYYYAPTLTNKVGVINALGATAMIYRDTYNDATYGKPNSMMLATNVSGWALGNTYQMANPIVLDGTFAAVDGIGRRLSITSAQKSTEGNVANTGAGIMKLEFTGGFSSTLGKDIIGSAPGYQKSGGAIYLENTNGIVRDSRTQIWLSGDSRNLIASSATVPGLTSGNSVFNIGAGYIVVNNTHALGLNNGLAVSNHFDNGAYQNGSSPGTIRALLSNGYDINASIDVTATGYNHNVIFGLTKDYSGSASFNGDIRLPRNKLAFSSIAELDGAAATPTVLLTAGADGQANFTGKIQDNSTQTALFKTPVMVQGLGKVKLSNTDNSYTGDTGVRSGTLLLGGNAGASGVLGNSTSAVLLGGEVPSKITVKVAANGQAVGTFNTTATTYGGGTGTLTGSLPTTLDGVTLANGDLILLNYQGYAPEQNGVYKRISANQWDRVAELDTAGEVAYGMRVEVEQGATFGGKAFFLANRWIDSGRWNLAPAQSHISSGGRISFVEDIANPSVAMLTDGAYTVGRNITVVNNLSTGTATLGGNTAHVSEFSGNVALNKALQVTAANGGTVKFSGDISGASGVTKIGAGLVEFNNAKTYTGATVVGEGALAVNDTLASTSVNVGNATLQGVGHISGAVTIAGGILSPGNSTGILTVDNAVTLDAASTFKVEVNGEAAGSGYDQLLVGGASSTVSLGGAALDLIAASELTGSMFWIIRNDSAGLLDGMFAGLANGAQVGAFTIHYGADFASNSLVGGNDVVLVVPEPATAGLVGLGAAAALMRRRRRSFSVLG